LKIVNCNGNIQRKKEIYFINQTQRGKGPEYEKVSFCMYNVLWRHVGVQR